MSTSAWGVVCVGSAAVGAAGERFAALDDLFGGLVVLPAPPAGNGRSGPTGGGSLANLLVGLREVPREAEIVTVLDGGRPLDETREFVARMLEGLDADVDGVVRGVPVTDALKRVDDDGTVVGDVDRGGLFIPQTPQVLRRPAIEAALLGAAPEPGIDPASFLVRCGYHVRMLWGAAHPARDAQRARG